VSVPAPGKRDCWQERFSTPRLEQLLARYAPPVADLVPPLLAGLRGIEGVGEELRWFGIPWRWSLGFRHARDLSREWAVLVLKPDKPDLIVPLTHALLERFPSRRFTRGVRDGIVHAPQVAGVFWAQWEITSRPQVDELLDLLKVKMDRAGQLDPSK
jgi:hypothetical protein